MSRVFVGGSWAYSPAEVFTSYRPRFHADPWFQTQRSRLVAWAERAEPETPTAAYKTMFAVCQFARFARDREIPLEPERLFTPENVEWYISTELSTRNEHSRSTQRAALRLVGRAITRRAAWPPADPRYKKPTAAEPYSATEQHHLISLSDIQATERRRRACRGAVCLGLGAGLRGPELERVRGSDVERRDGLVVVHVCGDRERVVPVRRQHAGEVLRLAFDYPDEPLLGPFKPHQRDPLSRIKSLLEIPSWSPPLELRRLRTTWMVAVLNEGIGLADFADAAGVTDLRFTHLLPHLTRKEPADVARRLAGTTA